VDELIKDLLFQNYQFHKYIYIITILLKVVHLYPVVPAAAKVQALKAMLRSASSKMIAALFPPSSNKDFPKLIKE
jgi:predicted ferric reductase